MTAVALDVRAEALFISNLQPSDRPTRAQIRNAAEAIAIAVGEHECAAYVPPRRGDRDGNLEWDGSARTPVCPDCDLAMSERDEHGCLCCPACGLTASDVKR